MYVITDHLSITQPVDRRSSALQFFAIPGHLGLTRTCLKNPIKSPLLRPEKFTVYPIYLNILESRGDLEEPVTEA